MPFKRTANCKNCGEVSFKIKPGVGHAAFKCMSCDNEDLKAILQDYETLVPICSKCDGDIFKVKVTVYEKGQQIYSEAKCEICDMSPISVYVDDEGKVINEKVREELITQDRLENLQEECNVKNDLIQELEERIDNLYDEITEKDQLIYNLNDEVEEKEIYIYKLEKKIEEKDNEINKLRLELDEKNNEIYELENRIS
ncbi:hypothetical protein [Clostridium sp.]|uniref:hypothetical protein n=1 Tax=Clostridium sp. TaxID=1506 RepID=UPI002FC8D01B